MAVAPEFHAPADHCSTGQSDPTTVVELCRPTTCGCAADSSSFAGFLLAAHIDGAGRIIAHQDGSQMRDDGGLLTEGTHFRGQVGPNLNAIAEPSMMWLSWQSLSHEIIETSNRLIETHLLAQVVNGPLHYKKLAQPLGLRYRVLVPMVACESSIVNHAKR